MPARWPRFGVCPAVLAFLATGLLAGPGARTVKGADAPQAKTADAAPLSLTADDREVWFALFAPDGKILATGGHAGVLKLWDLATREPRFSRAPSREQFRSAAFSPDGKVLATGRSTGTLTFWDAASGKVIKTLRGEHTDAIRSVSFTPDGKRLVTSGQDKKIAVWDTRTWRVISSIANLPQPILCSRIAPDGTHLAVALGDPSQGGGGDGGVRLYEPATLALEGDLAGLENTTWSVAFAPDGRTLATGWGGPVRLWDPETRFLRSSLNVPHAVRVVAFSPDGKLLLTAGTGRTGEERTTSGLGLIWDLAALKPKAILKGHGSLIFGASFSPDSQLLATGSGASVDAQVWEFAKLPTPPDAMVQAAAPAPPSNRSASADDGPVRFAEKPLSAAVPLPRVLSLALSVDGSRAVTGHQSELRIWDVAARRSLASESVPGRQVSFVTFSPDGTLIAAIESQANDLRVVIRDGKAGKVLRALRGETPGVTGAAFSPDGRELATSGRGKDITIWDVTTGTKKQTLSGHEREVTFVAYAADGKRLASSSLDRTARIWDAASGEAVAILAGHREGIQRVVFAPDGKTVATASYDQSIKL
jgi:WD40 repeat protein